MGIVWLEALVKDRNYGWLRFMQAREVRVYERDCGVVPCICILVRCRRRPSG